MWESKIDLFLLHIVKVLITKTLTRGSGLWLPFSNYALSWCWVTNNHRFIRTQLECITVVSSTSINRKGRDTSEHTSTRMERKSGEPSLALRLACELSGSQVRINSAVQPALMTVKAAGRYWQGIRCRRLYIPTFWEATLEDRCTYMSPASEAKHNYALVMQLPGSCRCWHSRKY